MQVPFNFLNKSLSNKYSIKNLFSNKNPSNFSLVKKPQMPADKIINYLEIALNENKLAIIQFNVSLQSESIYQLTGFVSQNEISNNLLITNPKTNNTTKIWPKNIRHISFN